jgi:hypothetical protein
MADPLENREFRHYLNFMSDDIGRLEITEPVKFDASEFVIEQDNYARHISFMNEEISLEFYDIFTIRTTEPYQLLNGTIVYNLSHCLDYLLYYNKRYGFQSKIQYILERNGVEFILGELNFEGSKTDELTYLHCKVVQNTERAKVLRRDDTKIDAFSTESIDGNVITAVETTNVLNKSKPFTQSSNWKSTRFFAYTGDNLNGTTKILYQNPINNLTVNGIESSLSYLNRFAITDDLGDFPESQLRDMVFVETSSGNELTNIKLKISEVKISYYIPTGQDFDSMATLGALVSPSVRIYIGVNTDITEILNAGSNLTYTKEFIGNESVSGFGGLNGSSSADRYDLTFEEQEITIGNAIPRGYRMYLSFYMDRYFTITNWLEGSINITGTATAIDTIIKATRYVDLIKQTLKSINGMTLNAPRFDEGGEFYDLFATTGNLIRQRDDVPFYITFKDRRENLALVNGDIQINETNAFALQYGDFYADVDNGAFNLAPSDSFESSFNPEYVSNLVEFKFKNYEKDKDEKNTRDVVHGESQWIPNNDKVKATKKIEVNDTFDPFSMQTQVNQLSKETTALEGDNKIFGLDCLPLYPGARGGFSTQMTHRVNSEGQVQLLLDANLPSWALTGSVLGGEFKITIGSNIGTYIVFGIENSIITLTPLDPLTQSFSGVALTTVDFPYTDVAWVNRTNEGFTIIENVLNPTNFANLRYAVRDCLVYWEQVLSTYALYITENIKNSEFLNNGLMRTQFGTNTIQVQNADMVLADIKPPLLTPKEYNVDLVVGYDDALILIAKYQNIETVGGFVRVQDTNGRIKKLYPKKLGYTWATKVLSVLGAERYESDNVTITKTGTTIFINRVGYEQESLSEIFYEASGDFIVLFDKNNVNLIDFTKYDKFIVQEQTFGNPVDLIQAIIDL